MLTIQVSAIYSEPNTKDKFGKIILFNQDGRGYMLINNDRMTIKRIFRFTPKTDIPLKTNVEIQKQAQIFYLKIQPNPIIEIGKVSFTLSKNSMVKIYTIDNSLNKLIQYEGILMQGDHSLQINTRNLMKGIIILYIEVNGQFFSTKAIKI